METFHWLTAQIASGSSTISLRFLRKSSNSLFSMAMRLKEAESVVTITQHSARRCRHLNLRFEKWCNKTMRPACGEIFNNNDGKCYRLRVRYDCWASGFLRGRRHFERWYLAICRSSTAVIIDSHVRERAEQSEHNGINMSLWISQFPSFCPVIGWNCPSAPWDQLIDAPLAGREKWESSLQLELANTKVVRKPFAELGRVSVQSA